MLYLDEAGKWEKPVDIREAWRIERTCLIVGKKVVGKALVGSTVNPMDKGGSEYKALWEDSNPNERNANGRTKTGLYRIFVPAYEALEGFFDNYGQPVIDDPASPVDGIDGDTIEQGSKTYLKNERDSLKDDASELNEVVRQFPFTEEEAFRDSIEGSLFNVGKIYQQIDRNNNLYPNPVVRGNFMWKEKDKEVIFSPDPNGRFHVAWQPKASDRNKCIDERERKNLVIATLVAVVLTLMISIRLLMEGGPRELYTCTTSSTCTPHQTCSLLSMLPDLTSPAFSTKTFLCVPSTTVIHSSWKTISTAS